MAQPAYTVRHGSRTATIIVTPVTMSQAVQCPGNSRTYVLAQAKRALGCEAVLKWNDLVFTRVASVKSDDEHCCDRNNCTQCDIGYHERCRHDCTIIGR